MSRHFERLISLAITRRLVRTGVTPDMMTLTSLAVGLSGAPFFLSSSPALQLAGSLLFLVHSILDGCDGELARLKFLQSRRGAILDYWGDNVVHVAVFLCIAIGWALSAGTPWPLALGAVAAVGTLGSAAMMFERTAADRPESADSPLMARLTAALASRDFIYGLILCSAFGKAFWFLIAAAAGTPAFFLVVLWIEHRRGRVR
jgi:1L-myo-inositol 1-phosphate cytidylyltransferase / CDP-L-myo-inositol myo-inositolphosphotransferase